MCGGVVVGTCAVLVNGGERSLCANLGAANTFTPDHLAKDQAQAMINKAQYFYIASFFLTVRPHTLIQKKGRRGGQWMALVVWESGEAELDIEVMMCGVGWGGV